MSEQRWEMTRGARRAVVFLFVLSFVLSGASFGAASHEIGSGQAATQRADQRVARAQAEAAAAKAQAASARAQQAALCRSGNEFRASQVSLWEFVIRLSGPATSPHARAVRAEFVHHLHAIFAPRDCATLGKRP